MPAHDSLQHATETLLLLYFSRLHRSLMTAMLLLGRKAGFVSLGLPVDALALT